MSKAASTDENNSWPTCPYCKQKGGRMNDEYSDKISIYCNNENCRCGSFFVDAEIHSDRRKAILTNDVVHDVTEEEYEQIQAEFDEWVLMKSHSDRQLHIHMCRGIKSGGDLTNVIQKPIDVFPYDFHDICDECLKDYRGGEISK